MPDNNPYKITDQAIALLNKRATRRFSECRSRLSQLRFDELNIIREVKSLYDQLAKDNKNIFLELAQEQYRATEPHGEEPPNEDWLLALLLEYNPTTLYVYEHEVDRKREYATESIIASDEKSQEFKKALVRWSNFTAEYADIITDEATIKAFDDAGVERVMWNTEDDAKVCHICEPLDGKVFDIDKAPPKQHWHCRCWLTPAD